MQIGLGTLLGIVFIILKLTGIIQWSWLWVLAPFWLGFAILLALYTALAIISASIR